MTETRKRVNAKSTSKGIWSLDVTVEVSGENVDVDHPDVLTEIEYQEELFRAKKRIMAGDSVE